MRPSLQKASLIHREQTMPRCVESIRTTARFQPHTPRRSALAATRCTTQVSIAHHQSVSPLGAHDLQCSMMCLCPFPTSPRTPPSWPTRRTSTKSRCSGYVRLADCVVRSLASHRSVRTSALSLTLSLSRTLRPSVPSRRFDASLGTCGGSRPSDTQGPFGQDARGGQQVPTQPQDTWWQL